MTNIEKVKRILDAGHWVKVTYEDFDDNTVTSYIEDSYSYIEGWVMYEWYMTEDINEDCTIEVIQRIPTPYKPGDKVLVLSNPSPICTDSKYIDMMVWKAWTIKWIEGFHYSVYNYDASDYFYFPAHCLSPAFEEDSLSWKEAKIVIDGKEYTCVIK